MIPVNYSNEDSFRTYVDYLALKKHFTTENYDYQKYRGKVKASFESFKSRKDAFFFYKISKKDDPHEFLLANIITDPKIWIRDMTEENSERVYSEWKGRKEALTYVFKNELKTLLDDYASNFRVSNGQHPHIMTLYLQKKISLETFTIITHLAKVYDYWQQEIVDKIVSSDIIRLSRKYYPFLGIDQKKFSKIVKEHFFEDK